MRTSTHLHGVIKHREHNPRFVNRRHSSLILAILINKFIDSAKQREFEETNNGMVLLLLLLLLLLRSTFKCSFHLIKSVMRFCVDVWGKWQLRRLKIRVWIHFIEFASAPTSQTNKLVGCLLICICLFGFSDTSNFSAIWRLSPLPVTGLQLLAYAQRSGPLSREGSLSCHTYCGTGPRFIRSHPKDWHPRPTVARIIRSLRPTL
jgi:hypothetical protein